MGLHLLWSSDSDLPTSLMHSPGLPLADEPRQMANNNLSLIAIAGPSRMLVTGVPLAYQGG